MNGRSQQRGPLLLRMRGIRKSFGPTEVLRGVDFELHGSEVQVLAGANGAGKSTLIKVLAGIHRDFEGTVELLGNDGCMQPLSLRSPQDAFAAGIATIHQELSLVQDMSVADNFFLGDARSFYLDRRREEREASAALREFGIEIDVRKSVRSFPLATQQRIEIARALVQGARILILDEATSALPDEAAERLFEWIETLCAEGASVVYITHKMEEIDRIADWITVLRDGVRVASYSASELDRDRLVEEIVGHRVDVLADPSSRASSAVPATPRLEVRDLSLRHTHAVDRSVLADVSFDLQPGEILGLAGLEGAGPSLLLRALFGMMPERMEGTLRLEGSRYLARTPREAIARGVVFLPGDRKGEGLVLCRSARENMALSALDAFRHGGLRTLDLRKEQRAVREQSGVVHFDRARLEDPVEELSGGNQQKVLLGRCLLAKPRLLMLEEPTRGVDVAAKEEIHRRILEARDAGLAVLLACTELAEVLRLSDRILVFHEGRIRANYSREEASREAVLAAAMGHEEHGFMGGRNSEVEGRIRG